jgi:hypothetical protein
LVAPRHACGYRPARLGTDGYVLNLQPVVPFHLNDNWNLITRTILPVVWNPGSSIPTVPVGTAPVSFTAFLSPSHDVNGWLWDAGPVVQFPTISSATLGSSVWGAGPSAAVVYSGGPLVAGVLVNNIFSLGGTPGASGNSYSSFLANPCVAYNLDDGWYLSSAKPHGNLAIERNQVDSAHRWRRRQGHFFRHASSRCGSSSFVISRTDQ